MTVAEFAPAAVRLLLAVIFLIAGTGKLANPRETIQTLRDFGVPRRLRPFGVFLPLLETAVAIALLFAATAWYAAWSALALLTLFIAGIGVNLARGRQPVCNCFGQLHSRPISWRTLLRNAVLAAGAGWLIISSRPRAGADLWAILVSLNSRGRRVAVVVAALIAFAILHALKQDEPEPAPALDDEPASRATNGRDRAHDSIQAAATPARTAPVRVLADIGLAVGTPAPEFDLPDLEGRRHSLESFRASGTSVLLLFSSPFCESCQALLPKLSALATRHEATLRLVLISRGTVPQNLAKMKGPMPLPVLLQQDFEVSEGYDSSSTPAAVLVSAGGLVQSLLAVGGPAIEQLISSSQAVGGAQPHSSPL